MSKNTDETQPTKCATSQVSFTPTSRRNLLPPVFGLGRSPTQPPLGPRRWVCTCASLSQVGHLLCGAEARTDNLQKVPNYTHCTNCQWTTRTVVGRHLVLNLPSGPYDRPPSPSGLWSESPSETSGTVTHAGATPRRCRGAGAVKEGT